MLHPTPPPPNAHPWERRIRDDLLDQIKHAHNTVNNPIYPYKYEPEGGKKYQFTIVGNRVTKEFIDSVELVKLLHKYRPKVFAAPIIRGTTGVEWPEVLHQIRTQFGGISYCVSNVIVFKNGALLGSVRELKGFLNCKYRYYLHINRYQKSVDHFKHFLNSSSERPSAYMHIWVGEEQIGTFIFMLYSDLVPLTCENFLRLCATRKGGYSGTPIHRIVKDGWIQCGGYGLKSSNLPCENYIVPPDRRGVLCMANDGRHADCSTQFFVLLQPALWMSKKYVAFGQLINGEETLKKIENMKTYYEAPVDKIVIAKAGILNMECTGLTINKGTNEYIVGHIENIYDLEEYLQQLILQNVFDELQKRAAAQKKKKFEDPEELSSDDSQREVTKIGATKRFMRNKDEIRKQLATTASQAYRAPLIQDENNDFDVEEYEFGEFEAEVNYSPLSPPTTPVYREKPYYIPLTDVPYPGEKESTYDLKKMLTGEYCLESDITHSNPERETTLKHISKSLQEAMCLHYSDFPDGSESSLDSDDEREMSAFFKLASDSLSFAGHAVRKISAKHNVLSFSNRKLTDEDLRKMRKIANAQNDRIPITPSKQVTVDIPEDEDEDQPKTNFSLKRRPTGLPVKRIVKQKPSELSVDDENELDISRHKVRITDTKITARGAQTSGKQSNIKDQDANRPSTLGKLLNQVDLTSESCPTLKNYKPLSEVKLQNIMLTYTRHLTDEDSENPIKPRRASGPPITGGIITKGEDRRIGRVMSSDYGVTAQEKEEERDRSLQMYTFSKRRPRLTILEYKTKNSAAGKRVHDNYRNVLNPEPTFANQQSTDFQT